MRKLLFVDFETNSGAVDKVLTKVHCCSIKPSDGELFTITDSFKEVIQKYIDDGYVPVAHNFGFDGWVMKQLGIEYPYYHDTMLIHYLLNPMDSHSLGDIGAKLGIEKLDFTDYDAGYSEEMKTYCERDVLILEKVFNTYFPKLFADEQLRNLYYNVELPLITLIMECEENGVQVDVDGWESIIEEVTQQRSEVNKQIMSMLTEAGLDLVLGKKSKTKKDRDPSIVSDTPEFGKWKLVSKSEDYYQWAMWEKFNPSSPAQVVEVFNNLGVQIEKSGKDVLNDIDHPLAHLLLEYRKLDKLVSSFGHKMLEKVMDGRIHPSYNQCVTLTGRLSCSKPNLQQIPSHGESGEALRKLFVAKEGHKLVSIDIDSFQMRIYAWYMNALCNGEDASSMFDDFNNNPEADPHQAKADLLGVERRIGKTLNFAGIFGQCAANAAKTAGVSKEEMESYYEIQDKKNPSAQQLKEAIWKHCKSNNGVIYDLYGRRGFYPQITSSKWGEKGRAERQAFNFIIQGTEASIIKQMWLMCWKFTMSLGAKPVLQVHDEYMFEVPEENAEQVAAILDHVVNDYKWLPNMKVTGTASVGNNWFEVH